MKTSTTFGLTHEDLAIYESSPGHYWWSDINSGLAYISVRITAFW